MREITGVQLRIAYMASSLGVLIGIAGTPSLIDSRTVVLKDLKVTGILSASPGLVGAIEILSSGQVDPRPLIASVVSLVEASDALSGKRPQAVGDGPKIQIKP